MSSNFKNIYILISKKTQTIFIYLLIYIAYPNYLPI
jgi:hypothetical protein